MNLNKQTLDDVDVRGKRGLIRVDFNVPQDPKTGEITNNQRIVGALPTINRALQGGARSVVLMSHLGRPDGQVVDKLTLAPVATRLSELLDDKPVTFLKDCVGSEVEEACQNPPDGAIIVLENLRFHAEEEGKGVKHVEGCKRKKCGCEKFKPSDDEIAAFRASLAKLGDVYVNDAFGTAHRAHSSMVGLKGKMPCVAGDLVTKELDAFSKVIGDDVQRPLTAIVGGAKISDKILVIENLIDRADAVILCGGMAYTFLKTVDDMPIGKSLFDAKGAELAPKLLEKAKSKNVTVLLPVDWACGKEFKNEQDILMVTKDGGGIPDDYEGMDCGPESMKLFREQILKSKTGTCERASGEIFVFCPSDRGSKYSHPLLIFPRIRPRRSQLSGTARPASSSSTTSRRGPSPCWRASRR